MYTCVLIRKDMFSYFLCSSLSRYCGSPNSGSVLWIVVLCTEYITEKEVPSIKEYLLGWGSIEASTTESTRLSKYWSMSLSTLVYSNICERITSYRRIRNGNLSIVTHRYRVRPETPSYIRESHDRSRSLAVYTALHAIQMFVGIGCPIPSAKYNAQSCDSTWGL